MLGAIIGDIVGSRFQFMDFKSKEFEFFVPHCTPTDDSFMTLAVAKSLLLTKDWTDLDDLKQRTVLVMKEIAHAHPNTGWGELFYRWLFLEGNPKPYNSFGNGAGMRISPVGWVADSEEEVRLLSGIVTGVSHNHPAGLLSAVMRPAFHHTEHTRSVRVRR